MKPIDIPKGYSAVFTYDHTRGWTVCTLVNDDFEPCYSGISRYNPKDFSDPKRQFDPELGCHIALGRAVKQYHKSNTKKSILGSPKVWYDSSQYGNDLYYDMGVGK